MSAETEKRSYHKPIVLVIDLTEEIELTALARCSGSVWQDPNTCS